MAIPLVFLLYLFFGFLAVWLIMSLAAIFHLLKHGPSKLVSFFVMLMYVAVSLGMLSVSYQYMSAVPWSMSINIFDSLSNINTL